MKFNKYTFIRLAAFVVSLFVIFNIWILPEKPNNVQSEEIVENSEMHGVWVSLIYNMDYPKATATDASVLKSYADEIISDCADIGINNIFLQVRAVSDSIYPSQIYPYSKYISGKQGTAPSDNFDSLAYWIEQCHKKGIKLHAWINPYRITTGKDKEFSELSPTNPAVIHPDYVAKSPDGNYYFDPGIPEVRDMVIAGAVEIAANYDVDGIHMDDYFYPSKGLDDTVSYEKYGGGTDKGLWRLNNVNTLVKDMGTAVKAVKPEIEFGISPSGIWANKENNPLGSDTKGMESYYGLYADTRQWALDEIIDYIAPQIYWNIGYEIADYNVLVNWWADTLKNSDTKLYIGIADYKAAESEDSSVWHTDGAGEIARQIALNDTIDKIDGEIHFRFGSIKAKPELYELLKNSYSNKETPKTEPEAFINKALKMTINNNFFYPKETDGSPLYPITYNDSTYLPARALAEGLGCEVLWNESQRRVIIKSGSNISVSNDTGLYPDELIKIEVIKNGITIEVDGKEIICNDEQGRIIEPIIYKDRTYIPVRAAAKALGADVEYIAESKTVAIKKK